MAIDMTPEERAIGQANFHRTIGQLAEAPAQGVTRRQFMKGLVAAGMVAPVSAAAYFGYKYNFGPGGTAGEPVKAVLIGAGDEGGVLIGEHNPDYLRFVGICDARPSNQERIFTGDLDEKGQRKLTSPRKGFNNIPQYGKDAKKQIKIHHRIDELLNDKSLDYDAVVIALPLHLHAPVAVAALKAGKHVLCEKLMAWNINECKRMIMAAKKYDRILQIGHQRHYSMLYAHAVEVLQSGVLGDVTHIRALWHRNNALPQLDRDKKPIPGTLKDGWKPAIPDKDKELAKLVKDLYPDGYKNLEEMVRWRIYNRTGGGLMAELGSHQLDASSIFLDAMARAGGEGDNGPHRDTVSSIRPRVHPLAVTGVGTRTPLFVKEGWEVDDQVFCSFEFPGKNYWKDPEKGIVGDKNDVVVVTYSSINTNQFERYGECVMGSRGTMVIELEQSVMLYADTNAQAGGRAVIVGVSTAGGGKPSLDTSSSTGGPVDTGSRAIGSGPVSRGYREEMEDFAFCIRMWGNKEVSPTERPLPRCHGQVAMGDAIIALTSNQAMAKRQRIEFQRDWFDPLKKAVPDGDTKLEFVDGEGHKKGSDLYEWPAQLEG